MMGFPIQTNFTTGEISPLMMGRVDFAKYFNSAKTLVNFIPKPQGGIFKRSGTKFITEAYDSSKKSRLIKFEFSNIQAYVLEFSENKIRVFRNGGIVESAPSVPLEITTTYLESELFDIRTTQSADVLYIVHPNHKPAKLSRTSHTSWVLEDLMFTDGPYREFDESGAVLKITAFSYDAVLTSASANFVVGMEGSYAEVIHEGRLTLVYLFDYVSTTNFLVKIFPNVINPKDLDRTSHVFFEPVVNNIHSNVIQFERESEFSFIKARNYGASLDEWYFIQQFQPNTVATANPTGAGGNSYNAQYFTVATSGTLNGVTLTEPIAVINTSDTEGYELKDIAITATIEASKNTFASTDVGRMIRLTFEDSNAWFMVETYTNATTIQVSSEDFIPREHDLPERLATNGWMLANNGVTDKWRWGAWKDDDYPSVIAFHENRLIFASSPSFPQTLWMSKTDDYTNFAPSTGTEVLDDNAINYSFSSREVNKITWIASSGTLVIGTQGEEWVVRASSLREPLTPTNTNFDSQTPFGSRDFNPIMVGNSIIFLQRSGNVVRDYFYDFSADRFTGNDLTIISEHILREKGGAIEMTYQQEPSKLIWFTTGTGELVSVTFEKAQDIYAWANHTIGGTDAFVESVVAIPYSDNSRDELYLSVRRTVDGNTVRYIEIMQPEFESDDPLDMFFVDSGLSYSGSAVNTVTGLDHLEGETVKVIADGMVRDDEVVASGAVTFSGDAATDVVVGLSYTPIFSIVPIEAGSVSGTAQGKQKLIYGFTGRIYKTKSFTYGTSLSNMYEANLRELDVPMDSGNNFYTGDLFLELDSTYALVPEFHISQDEPVSLVLLMLAPKVQSSDR